MRKQSFSDAVENAPAELTIIGQGTRVEGKAIKVAGDLRVDGEVDVEEIVVGERIIVSPSGNVEASRVRAREAAVAGAVQAQIEIESTLVLKETGRVSGTIVASRLIVEEGGICDGSFNVGPGALSGQKGPRPLSQPQTSSAVRPEPE